jgi:hypothetical protein
MKGGLFEDLVGFMHRKFAQLKILEGDTKIINYLCKSFTFKNYFLVMKTMLTFDSFVFPFQGQIFKTLSYLQDL